MKTVKCVVWDLDGTLWDGVLLEDRRVTPRPEIVEAITTLSERGILHSIASRNDADAALAKLSEHGLDEHFLYPQIGWHAKSRSIPEIARRLNFGIDALAFVDDQRFELEEVGYRHPSVLCVAVDDICDAVRSRREFQPRFITDESRIRRLLYRSEERRVGDEEDFVGTSEDFLATLDMRLKIAPALEDDLQRAEELTVRTNQLNSTGRTYSYEQLAALREDPDHLLLVASLEDRYGPYGRIGLVLVETGDGPWTLRLLLMSCRVMSRGVGSVLLHHVMRLARAANASLHAELVETGRNRLMYVTYRFAGFREVRRDGDALVLEADLSAIPEPPAYLALEVV
ncbi:MAG TPA: HAD-IIIC family phosphatase [Solirubrobacteraceae bacterium]|nr:HAD-IIIC family phosphatase [Solirubrobacteraceae bacterium]